MTLNSLPLKINSLSYYTSEIIDANDNDATLDSTSENSEDHVNQSKTNASTKNPWNGLITFIFIAIFGAIGLIIKIVN
jgi:hypothetical protein